MAKRGSFRNNLAIEMRRDLTAYRAAAPALPDLADALWRTRRAPAANVHKGATLYAADYGPAVRPNSVAGIWGDRRYVSYRARLDVIRRGACIAVAEVSQLVHHGNFGSENTGYGAIEAHAHNILGELTSAAPNCVSWAYQLARREPSYAVRVATTAEDDTAVTLVRSQQLGAAAESNSVFGYANLDGQFIAQRDFVLIGETVFATSGELIETIADGGVSPYKSLDLSSDNAAFAEELVLQGASDQDVRSMLVPAFTSFILSQTMPMPQVPSR